MKHILNLWKWLLFQIEGLKRWNWQVIIYCYITATTFWLFHSLNSDHTTSLSIPIKVVHNKENVVCITPPPKNLNISVSGYGWTILTKFFRKTLGLDESPILIELDDPVGRNFISSRNLRLEVDKKMRDLNVNYIIDDSLFFKFDTLETKSIYITIDSPNIALEDGHEIISPIVLSHKVLNFEGPASLVKELPDTIELVIRDNPINADFDKKLPVNYEKHPLIKPEETKIGVSFSVARFLNKTYDMPLTLVNFPNDSSIKVFPDTGTLYYKVREDLDTVNLEKLSLILDYEELNPQDSTICPFIELPEVFLAPEINPGHFKITPPANR